MDGKYDLSAPEKIRLAAEAASKRAGMERNQGSYNAAWLHGYAEALADVADQLSPPPAAPAGDIGPVKWQYGKDGRTPVKLFYADGATLRVPMRVFNENTDRIASIGYEDCKARFALEGRRRTS